MNVKNFYLKKFVSDKNTKNAFTLAEVIIVMLVVAVVAGICIKITKAKLNNILSVNYYSSYNTLKTISTELFRDFKQKKSGFSDEKCILSDDEASFSCYSHTTTNVCTVANWSCNVYDGKYGIDCSDDIGLSYGRYATKGSFPYPIESDVLDLFKSAATHVLNDSIGFDYADECINASDGGFAIISEKTITSLYKGQNFCEKFVENANTASSLVSDECKGDNISDTLTNFSNKDPDFVLRNGMKFYNFSQDPTKISVLKGNSRGKKHTTKDGTVMDLDEWGYTVYVDVDGEKGKDSKLWKDVYRFYITLSGTVIPAYDSANSGDFGGDSTFHLQTSVSDQYTGASGGREFRWVTKSKSFKESACKMGLVKTVGGNTYCDGVTPDNECATNDSHDCKLKTIVPIKFFN